MMMNNNAMVQELNDTQLDMVVGGFSFSNLYNKVRRSASSAWKVTKKLAGITADVVEFVAETTVRR